MKVSDDTPVDLACRGGGSMDLSDVFVHEYHCALCEETSFVDVEITEVNVCHRCNDPKRRVSDEPICLAGLL